MWWIAQQLYHRPLASRDWLKPNPEYVMFLSSVPSSAKTSLLKISLKYNSLCLILNHIDNLQIPQQLSCHDTNSRWTDPWENILDLLISASLDHIQNVEVSPGISDHCCVSADVLLKTKMTKKPARKIFMYNKANNATELQSEIASSRETNENLNFFTKGLMKIIHKLVLQKVTRQWYNLS